MSPTEVLIAGAGPSVSSGMDTDALVAHLACTFGASVSTSAAADLR
jgi:hypothetical protein